MRPRKQLILNGIGTVPKFVPHYQFPAQIDSDAGQPTILLSYSYRMFFGAGRGNRTPMELLPTDFEFPENTVCL